MCIRDRLKVCAYMNYRQRRLLATLTYHEHRKNLAIKYAHFVIFLTLNFIFKGSSNFGDFSLAGRTWIVIRKNCDLASLVVINTLHKGMHERIIHSLTTRSWTREKVSNNIQDIRNRKVRMYTLRYLSYFNDRKTQGNTKRVYRL